MARPLYRWVDRARRRLTFDPWHLGNCDYVLYRVFACPWRNRTPEAQAYTIGWYHALGKGCAGLWCATPPVWLRRHKGLAPQEGCRKNWAPQP